MKENSLTSLPIGKVGRKKKVLGSSITPLPPSPSDIGTWQTVVELNFGTNQIQKLPDDIACLANLEVLILSNNLLRKLPSNVGQLQKLRVLDLEENKLEAIPNEIGRLRELQKLILQSNSLTQLPRAIGSVSLFSLSLSLSLSLSSLSLMLLFLFVCLSQQATVQTGVHLRGREPSAVPPGGDRLPGVARVALHQRQPAPTGQQQAASFFWGGGTRPVCLTTK